MKLTFSFYPFRVKKIIMEGIKSLNIYNQNADAIKKQAEATARKIFDFHAENPTPGTSAFIRKFKKIK